MILMHVYLIILNALVKLTPLKRKRLICMRMQTKQIQVVAGGRKEVFFIGYQDSNTDASCSTQRSADIGA